MRESRKIKAGSIEEEMIANWTEEGLGFRLTTMFLNEHLKEEGHEEIGVKSVYNAFNRLNPLITKIKKKHNSHRIFTFGQKPGIIGSPNCC